MILASMALRNLFRQKRRSFLLGGALAFSVFIIVVLNGLTGGIQSSVAKNSSDLVSGHIFFAEIEKDENGRLIQIIKNDESILKKIKEQGLKYTSLSRRTVASGTLMYWGESIMRVLYGVSWKEETILPKSLQCVVGSAGEMDGSTGILISTTLCESLGMIPKEELSPKEQEALKSTIRNELQQTDPDKKTDNRELTKRFNTALKEATGIRKQERKNALEKSLGETILVYLSTIYGQQNVGEFQIHGIFQAQFDIAAYVDREVLNELIDIDPGSYNFFGIFLENTSDLDMKTTRLYQAMKQSGDYDMYPIEQIMGRNSSQLTSDLMKENFTGSKVILTNLNNELGVLGRLDFFAYLGSIGLMLLLLPIIMVGIYNTYRIVVYERIREIGTMRALGTQKKQVRNLFLLEASFLSLGGLIAGCLVGVVVLLLIHLPEFTSVPSLTFFLDKGHLAFTIQPSILVTSLILVCGLTLLAAYFPARQAARLKPVQALRGIL